MPPRSSVDRAPAKPETRRLPAPLERALARSFLRLPRPLLRRIAGPAVRSPEGFELDVQIQALIALARASHLPELHEGGVAVARRNMDRSLPSLDFAGVRDLVTIERRIPGPAGTMQARVYVPTAAADPSPGLVWLHGGGWVLGSIDSHDGICRALSSRARLIVVSVDYRLAPEHPFPAGADDAVAATRWVLANAAGLGIDPGRVAVGGDSAGGNLAAVTSQNLRDDPRRPAFQLLVYPGTDLTRSLPSHQKFREGFFLTEAGIDWFIANAFPDIAVLRDPRASPLFAKDLGRLPPALVLTGGFDPLRDEGNAYAEKMRAAGTKVELCCAESLPHGFFSMAGSIDEAARMFDLAVRSLRTALGSGTSSAPR